MDYTYVKEIKEANAEALIFCLYNTKENQQPVFPSWVDASSPQFKDFFANLGQMVELQNIEVEGKKFSKIILLGLGQKEKLNQLNFSSAYASAFNSLKHDFYSDIAIFFDIKEFAKVLSAHIYLADYSFDKYKEKKGPEPKVKKIYFICKENVEQELSVGKIFAQATNYARSIQNEPPNIATTSFIVKEAKKLSKENGFECLVLSKEDLKKKNMNGILAVGSGSVNPPYLVALIYKGDKNKKSFDLGVVGKGIVFDSGGLSLKPSEYMEEMKFDKSGACAVLGIFHGLGKLKPKKNIVGILALAENLPSSSSYRPGDIIKAYNNKTIEVLNTDAEGRIVLADALAYCVKEFEPNYLIDLATLTGACVVALGDLAAGLMCADEEFSKKLLQTGQETNERLWPLPVWEEYDEKVKSQVADVKNVGERGNAGAIAGYSFLKIFVDSKNKKLSWAHIDIAGTAWAEKPKFGLVSGGLGFGVRLVLEYIYSKF
ncbi:MAG: leucyl aminopeptidase family protein [Candidatus Anstonellaceae archaeon]